ncbi:MAG TPA: DHA2 family efflux MFS transporter permease subunit [Acidimicrobiia bacterium]|nr:DHA2 family efflux MFS transporter permease subunit [Acidimicrobiia bacterium]
MSQPAGTLTGGRLAGAFIALMVVNTMSGVDTTIVSTAAPTITSDLGRLSLLPWISTAYLLAQIGTIALYGKLGDLYGRKRVFLTAASLFLVASVLCGAAQSMPQLVAFRFLQGAGAGGLTGLAMAIVADIAPPSRVGRYLGYAGLVYAFTSVLGPLTGGLFVDHLSWRWAFYINLVPGLIGGAFVIALVPSEQKERIRHRIDVLGAILLAATTTALVLTTSWGGSEYEWTSPVIVFLVIAVVGAGAAFVFREQRAPEPLVPLGVLRERTVSLSIGANLVAGAAFTAGIVFLPILYQAVIGRDATSSGLLLIPLGLATALSTVVAGQVVDRYGGVKVIPATGMVTMALAYAALSTVDADTSAAFGATCALFVGIGVGCVMQTLLHVVQRSVPIENLGIATSSVMLGRIMGSALGVALFGAIFNARLEPALAAIPGVVPDDVHGDPASIRQLGAGLRHAVAAAFADALAGGFTALVGVSLLGLGTVLALRGRVLRRRIAIPVDLDAQVAPTAP